MEYRRRAAIINFILKFYFYVKEWEGFLLTYCLLVVQFRFDVMLSSNLGNDSSDVGHIQCSRGPHLARRPRVPHPCFSRTWSKQYGLPIVHVNQTLCIV